MFARELLTDGDRNRTPQGNPGIVNGEGQTAYAQQAIVSLELVPVPRSIDDLSVFTYEG